MTNQFELYKCNICGNIIEILISGDGHPVCCGLEMDKIEVKNDTVNSPDLTEKHSPVIETTSDGTFVTVKKHPMSDEHYIMFVQTISKDKTEQHLKFFYPSETVSMKIDNNPNEINIRSYCNIHGMYVG